MPFSCKKYEIITTEGENKNHQSQRSVPQRAHTICSTQEAWVFTEETNLICIRRYTLFVSTQLSQEEVAVPSLKKRMTEVYFVMWCVFGIYQLDLNIAKQFSDIIDIMYLLFIHYFWYHLKTALL
jgi:hypothetical protein